jgi:DNA-binding response OmpR family regulator
MDCPHCGGIIDPGAPKPLQHEVFDDATRSLRIGDDSRHLTPAQWKILVALRERYRRCVSNEFLATASARNPLDGGCVMSVMFHVVYLRRKLVGSPFTIANFRGHGHGLFPVDEVECKPSAAGLLVRLK